MRIDKKLNLVIPILGDPKIVGGKEVDNVVAYVHTTPISREVFDAYYMVLAKTFSKLYTEGLNWRIGPRVAFLTLKTTATEDGSWDGPTGVQAGLVNEIQRLTNIAVPSPTGGWTTVPYPEAVTKGLISADDAAEVDNAVTFFIVASAMHKRTEIRTVVTEAAKLWGGQITSLNSTEFAASLQMSTGDVSSGAKAAV